LAPAAVLLWRHTKMIASGISDNEGGMLHVTSDYAPASGLWRTWAQHLTPLMCVLVFVVVGFGIKHTLVQVGMSSSISMIAGSFWCCGRGLEGAQGKCIRGTSGSVCSAGDIPLLCGAGSTAHLNGNGHPFCCGPSSTGCDSICVDFNRRDSILMNGRQCNDVAPQGLRTPGRVQHLGIPWDGQLQRYKFGTNVAIIDGVSTPRGTGDFTVTATITPRRDGQISFARYAVLLFRRQSNITRPMALYVGYDQSIRQFEFFLGGTLDFTSVDQGASGEFDDFRANVPVTVRFIRQGVNISIFANETMIGNNAEDVPLFDFDNSLAFPLEIGPAIFPINSTEAEDILVAMDADVSDIAISDTAEVPPMAAQVSA